MLLIHSCKTTASLANTRTTLTSRALRALGYLKINPWGYIKMTPSELAPTIL